jgi:alanyl-tRNA synthetase
VRGQFPSYSTTSSSPSPSASAHTDGAATASAIGAAELRKSFLSYFARHDHSVVASSSLVPHGDPSLLFTNAGMVQFKDVFAGTDTRPYTRATSSQKCVRAGGKHNDLDNVGFTARHHTFFEMLGSFSFGDYFKEEAIVRAWDFLTRELGMPKERLRASVYTTDDESAALWKKVAGFDEQNGTLVRFGEADNFWSMGDGAGPCGPCSEVFWDQGKEVDGDRWLEIWNLVFMQHMRGADGTLTDLPRPSVDTGMGLERLAAVMQGVETNFDIDMFQSIIDHLRSIVALRGDGTGAGTAASQHEVALRIIADHARSATFLIADGVMPSNLGRGYVLRRIIRRAIRFGTTLGIREPFLAALVVPVIDSMGGAYPDLTQEKARIIETVVTTEETAFLEALFSGTKLLHTSVLENQQLQSQRVVPGEVAFRLYDSMGFPLDLTQLIAREHGWTVDEVGFTQLMSEQRNRSKADWDASAQGDAYAQTMAGIKQWQASVPSVEFTGYEQHTISVQSEIRAIAGAQHIEHLDQEEEADASDSQSPSSSSSSDKPRLFVCIDPCPFYGEAGGQTGDRGHLEVQHVDGALYRFPVVNTTRPYDGMMALEVDVDPQSVTATNQTQDGIADIAHSHSASDLAQLLRQGSTVRATVDEGFRAGISAHHTATHLLHAALKDVVGPTTVQAGSLVESNRLRFDFSSPKPIPDAKLRALEAWVNDACISRQDVATREMSHTEAKQLGAQALFGEKYGDVVRVVEVPGFSMELCGGTHVQSSLECFPFKIISESAVAAGTRRIEAVCGRPAVQWYERQSKLVSDVVRMTKSSQAELSNDVKRLLDQSRAMKRENQQLKQRVAELQFAQGDMGDSDSGRELKCGSTPVLIRQVSDEEASNSKLLKSLVEHMHKARKTNSDDGNSNNSAVYILFGETNGRFVVSCQGDRCELSAKDIAISLTSNIGGKGGGKPIFAQGALQCDDGRGLLDAICDCIESQK